MKATFIAAIGLALAACGGAETPNQTGAGGSQADVQATTKAPAEEQPAPSGPAQEAPAVPVLEQTLAYGESQDSNFVGYLAMPKDAAEPLPALIVIHEQWGLNDDIKAMTRRLAGEGYVALAVDLYAGKLADTPAQAEQLMTETMNTPDAVNDNIRQAYQYLTSYALAPKVATIGWSFGGALSLESALMLSDKLAAAVMYYGQVMTDQSQLESLQAPLLGLFAQNDQMVPARQVQLFRSRLNALGKTAEVRIYPGVAHAFADPGDSSFNAEAAKDAWDRTVAFLHMYLQ